MSKKPKEASDYMAEWCNGKIKFEDALRDFANYHVSKALEEVADKVASGIYATNTPDFTSIINSYPITNIV